MRCVLRSASSRRAGKTVGADRRLSEGSPEDGAALVAAGTDAERHHEESERQRRDKNIGGEESGVHRDLL